ncbi:hypothetical protein V5O48_013429 [Marasmius crinis-equi]|uniref:Uncharacterized protein n=1 Tax=Marasmius crinis-equi TaxID=585013 RepID=A0ABR3F085_9AGAR
MRTITIPVLYTSFSFPVLLLLLLSPSHALEFRSISGPPEQGGTIDPGGVLVIGCTLQYPGKLEPESTNLFLVGSDGKRTQATYSGLNSTTASQSFSTVGVPKELESGWYFLVAVENVNNTVIASSTNFQISGNVRNSSTTLSSASLPTGLPTSNPNSNTAKRNTNAGTIAGGVIGGLIGLVALGVLCFKRRRSLGQKKDPELVDPYTIPSSYQPPPSSGPVKVTSPTDSDPREQTQMLPPTTNTTTFSMREQREQILSEKERLEHQIDQIRLLPPLPTEREGEEEGEMVIELRNQVDAMTQRIAMLEAELADVPPPDYVSSYGGR